MSKEQFLKEKQKAGETYAGLMLGQNGEQDYHLFILPGEAENVTWSKAKEWAKKVGGDLPTRREQRVLFANAKDEFKPDWYWSGEVNASNSASAWYQRFLNGYQNYYDRYYSLRARAVRRLVIE